MGSRPSNDMGDKVPHLVGGVPRYTCQLRLLSRVLDNGVKSVMLQTANCPDC